MATIGGAQAIGKENEIGSLEKGKKADMIALDLDEIGWAPFGGQDFYAALVYSVTGYHVKDVMVNGHWLFRDNRWLTVDFNAGASELEVNTPSSWNASKNKREIMKKLIIDTDRGVDDAHAMLLALAAPGCTRWKPSPP